MLSRLLAAVALLALAAAVLVASWPQLLGLQRELPIAQVVSLRGVIVAGAAALVVLSLLLALTVRRARRFAGALAVIALVGGLLNTAVLAGRGAGGEGFQTASPASVTVLVWNTLGEAPGARGLADLVLDTDAQVVALPETTEAYGVEVAELLRAEGVGMQVLARAYSDYAKADSTVLLVAESLGEYRIDDGVGGTAILPSVVARPASGQGPSLAAVHPVAPLPRYMDSWRADLEWAAGVCDEDDMIMAGDFNSTLDHWAGLGVDGGQLGVCSDAADAAGAGAIGTWPTSAPPLLGSAIDHVLAGPAWEVTGARVIGDRDGAGSDHRPVLAQLTPAA
jgi:hypothetical protein